jgi:hypothetical protein
MHSPPSALPRTRTERIQLLHDLWEKVTQESDARPSLEPDHLQLDHRIEEVESGRLELDLDL